MSITIYVIVGVLVFLLLVTIFAVLFKNRDTKSKTKKANKK